MVTIILHCLHCGSDVLVRDGHAPNGKQKYRCHACGRRSRENPTPNVYPEACREEILHAYQERSSLRGFTRTFGVSRATVAGWIKKSSSASSFKYHLGHLGPRGSHYHDPGTGRTVVVCAQKSARLLDLDSSVPQDTTGGGLCRWGSEQKDVPAVVGGDSAGVSPGPLLYGLFEGVCGCHPRGATYSRGQRDGRNRPCRALEQHATSTLGPLCPHDSLVF